MPLSMHRRDGGGEGGEGSGEAEEGWLRYRRERADGGGERARRSPKGTCRSRSCRLEGMVVVAIVVALPREEENLFRAAAGGATLALLYRRIWRSCSKLSKTSPPDSTGIAVTAAGGECGDGEERGPPLIRREAKTAAYSATMPVLLAARISQGRK